MPGPRPTARPGAGPGRGKPRARPQARDRGASADPSDEPTVAFEVSRPAGASSEAPRTARAGSSAARRPAPKTGSAAGTRSGSTAIPTPGRRSAGVLHRAVRANLTARALALVVVVLVLTISYATSLRIYFAQAHEIAATKAQITRSQAEITDLQGRLTRWDDPAYVTTQARERLGWLVPGETGYTVVGADGRPLGGGLTVDSSASPDPGQPSSRWWDRMWGSVVVADKPAKAKVDPATLPPVTASSQPR